MDEPTIRVSMSEDEWWPVYEAAKDDGGIYEIPVALLERYKAALEEFDAVQDELSDYYHRNHPPYDHSDRVGYRVIVRVGDGVHDGMESRIHEVFAPGVYYLDTGQRIREDQLEWIDKPVEPDD